MWASPWRLGGRSYPPERRPEVVRLVSISIVPLTPDTWAALEGLFREGGDPRWCWCQFWRMRNKDFAALKVPQLREALHHQAWSDEPPGLVAFDGERAVGWVSLAPREAFERLEHSKVIPRVDDAPVWSVVCFAVSESARGRGVGRALLDAAVTYAADQGATMLESYPADVPADGRLSADAAFSGTRSMFEAAGFELVAPTGSKVGGVPRVIVRRELRSEGRDQR